MKQRTVEKPEAIRLEPCEQTGFIQIVVTTGAKPLQVDDPETGSTRTEYESDVYRLTYPEPDAPDALKEYAAANVETFATLAAAEENAGAPTQNADKLAGLMIENAELRTTQDDIVLMVTDMMGGVE